MRVIDVSRLRPIGSGEFGAVYRISSKRIIKVYNNDYYDDCYLDIMAEEIELSYLSKHSLPVLGTAIAKKNGRLFYAVIKEYLPYHATSADAIRLRELFKKNKRTWVLADDCYSNNVRKDRKGRTFLIDTQGDYAWDAIG